MSSETKDNTRVSLDASSLNSDRDVKQPYDINEDVIQEEADELLRYGADEILDPSADGAPLPEVRAVVSPHDDPSLPVNTFRAWFLGIIFTIIGSGVNQFFSMRYPGVTITSLVAQLISIEPR
ncbi:unnamed protein product [Ambrosiozyma monospora]|uniref:Unnamed protein product n=1 Tax=Ambrosiozyma monospora TaxID=43982 RepID=A0A9W6T9C6_AMBMO|nr:unnamed protein product [Ambrosiozyma monospora]